MPTKKETTAETKPKKKAAPKASAHAGAEESSTPAKAPRKRAPKAKVQQEPEAEETIVHPHAEQPEPVLYVPEVTDEMIAVRAYFLAENRHANGEFGDHSGDWLEAERQLRAENAAIMASLQKSR
jgi:hypothetical protein